MKVNRIDMVRLFQELGVDTADQWDNLKLAVKCNHKDGGITRYVEEGMTIDEPGAEKLFIRIAAHQKSGGVVEVVDDAPAPPPVAKLAKVAREVVTPPPPPEPKKRRPPGRKPAAPDGNPDPQLGGGRLKRKKHAAGRPEPAGGWREERAFYGKHPLPLPDDGVLRVTYDELVHAGKGAKPKPVTKEYLLGVLVERFPGRTRDKLETNLNNNVPGRLAWKYGVEVSREKVESGRMGYYITPVVHKAKSGK